MEPITQFTGRRVMDAHGDEIGTVTDVTFDDVTFAPVWAIVSYGLFNQHHRIMPADSMYHSDNGYLITSVTKAQVHGAPAISANGVVTPEKADEARAHYHASVS